MEQQYLFTNYGWLTTTTFLTSRENSTAMLVDIATQEERDGAFNGKDAVSVNLNLCGCNDVSKTRVNFPLNKDAGNILEVVAFDRDEIGRQVSPNHNYKKVGDENTKGNYTQVITQDHGKDNLKINVEVTRVVKGDKVYMSINNLDGSYSADIEMTYDPNDPSKPKDMTVYVKGKDASGRYEYSVNPVGVTIEDGHVIFGDAATPQQGIDKDKFEQNPARMQTETYKASSGMDGVKIQEAPEATPTRSNVEKPAQQKQEIKTTTKGGNIKG